MERIYANPVGIMRKDIYVIKNLLNKKVYIGQSVNPAERFKSHCKDKSSNSLIASAVHKYGKENFYYEILEHDVENYNELEKFWINKLNSLSPNGYNLQPGGEEPPVFYGVDHPNASIKSEETLEAIKNDLIYTTKSYSEIAQNYDTNKKTVLSINNGTRYSSNANEYPLRKVSNLNGILTEENIDEIIDILKYSYRQYGSISKQFGVGIKAIEKINAGDAHRRENIVYPIRNYKNSGNPQFTYEEVTEIIDLIQNTRLSYREIAKRYNSGHNIIIEIKNGTSKRYFREGLTYPLRANN